MTWERVALQNYRCFRGRQTARLAPLTLLVGDNSTGKTSFLALLRALWDAAAGNRVPDFKEPPYDLGSFEEIAHHRGGRSGRAETFAAEIDVGEYHFAVTFGKQGTAPVPIRKLLKRRDRWIEQHWEQDTLSSLQAGTASDTWDIEVPPDRKFSPGGSAAAPLSSLLAFPESDGVPSFSDKDKAELSEFAESWSLALPGNSESRPFASAPVRSRPHRTYDPARVAMDTEGDYIPMYLADLHFRNRRQWERLKVQLERFGQSAGLFDEISIRQLGRKDSEPFQMQVRRYDGALKGPQRNLIDVGYGVSQVLPVLVELLRVDHQDNDNLRPLLLQQPEVHLHPSAQAALGSLFCNVAGPHRQLVVETHSDHLIDRVRMEVRDRTTALLPEHVSVLFFERGTLDVRIHSLRIDDEGNILDAPNGYRQFFMEETRRSMGSEYVGARGSG